jgi:hypothetical protein
MTESSSASPQRTAGNIASALYLSGAVTIVVGIVLGIAISPALFGIAVLGVVDFVIGRLFATGRIGPLSARRAATEAGDAAAVAETDPNFNPYARED